MKKNKNKTRKRTRTMVCSDCGKRLEVSTREVFKASRIRCPSCGGPLNKPREA